MPMKNEDLYDLPEEELDDLDDEFLDDLPEDIPEDEKDEMVCKLGDMVSQDEPNRFFGMLPLHPERSARLKIYPHPYYERKGCLCLGKGTPGEVRMSLRRLCNFLPWITEEITLDDGIEPTKRLKLGGYGA